MLLHTVILQGCALWRFAFNELCSIYHHLTFFSMHSLSVGRLGREIIFISTFHQLSFECVLLALLSKIKELEEVESNWKQLEVTGST